MFQLLFRWSGALTLVWALVILYLSVLPGHELPEINIWEPDKVAHVVVYALLGFLMGLWLLRRNLQYRSEEERSRVVRLTSEELRKCGLIALGLGMSYGFGIEVVQGTLIPSRVFDLFDILSNFFGSLAGF